jgi:hypothetical protein
MQTSQLAHLVAVDLAGADPRPVYRSFYPQWTVKSNLPRRSRGGFTHNRFEAQSPDGDRTILDYYHGQIPAPTTAEVVQVAAEKRRDRTLCGPGASPPAYVDRHAWLGRADDRAGLTHRCRQGWQSLRRTRRIPDCVAYLVPGAILAADAASIEVATYIGELAELAHTSFGRPVRVFLIVTGLEEEAGFAELKAALDTNTCRRRLGFSLPSLLPAGTSPDELVRGHVRHFLDNVELELVLPAMAGGVGDRDPAEVNALLLRWMLDFRGRHARLVRFVTDVAQRLLEAQAHRLWLGGVYFVALSGCRGQGAFANRIVAKFKECAADDNWPLATAPNPRFGRLSGLVTAAVPVVWLASLVAICWVLW